jgi:hypothetical protein
LRSIAAFGELNVRPALGYDAKPGKLAVIALIVLEPRRDRPDSATK